MRNWILHLAQKTAAWMPRWLLAAMYRLGPLSQWLRTILNRSAPRGAGYVEVASGPLKGMEIEIDLQSEKDYWLGSYEMDLMDRLEEMAKNRQIAFDVGANIGYISLALARVMGNEGRVYAFEALPDNVAKLKRNVAHNHFEERVIVRETAIADQSGKGHFQVHRSGFMGKLKQSDGREEQYQQSIEVDTLALDDAIDKGELPAPDLVKIDIEGGESLAVQGMRKLLRKRKPLLLIELHGFEAARSVFEQLKQAGYAMRNLTGSGELVDSVDQLDWKAYIVAEARK